MSTQRALRAVGLVCVSLGLIAGCAAPTSEDTASTGDDLIALPIRPITVVAQPKYFTAGPNSVVALTPYASSICMLQRLSGAFDNTNLPRVQLYAQNGTYYLSAGMNVTAEAVCVDWGAFSGTVLGPNLYMSTQMVVPTSEDESITGYKIATLDANPGDACFLFGIHGDWLTNVREPGGVYTRVNGAWIYPSNGAQDFQVLTNGVGAGGDGYCYQRPGGKAFTQSSYQARWYGPTSVTLPNVSTAICGLTGIQGGLDDWNDAVQIVQNADGSQELEITEDPYDTLWASATCLPYAQ